MCVHSYHHSRISWFDGRYRISCCLYKPLHLLYKNYELLFSKQNSGSKANYGPENGIKYQLLPLEYLIEITPKEIFKWVFWRFSCEVDRFGSDIHNYGDIFNGLWNFYWGNAISSKQQDPRIFFRKASSPSWLSRIFGRFTICWNGR